MRAVFAFLFDCATVSLAELSSANIVGYQNNAVSKGYAMVTPSFTTVGGVTEYNIDDLRVIGAPDTMANICVMNAAGEWIGQYYWYNDAEYMGQFYKGGWFDFNGATPAGVTLKPGDAVYFYTSQDGVTIESAGEVAGLITIDAPNGYCMVGNGTPVSLPIDDMRVSGAPDTMANICVMNAAGEWVGQYYWYNDAEYMGQFYKGGWFDFNGATPAGITLAPGESVYFYTNQNGVKVTIPSALK